MNITVGRYDRPSDEQRQAVGDEVHWPADRYDCWVQPSTRGWTLFVTTDGQPVLYVADAGDTPLGGVVYPPSADHGQAKQANDSI